jgi:hypothetical protein
MAVPGNIRSWQSALDSRCNWGWLLGAFGPKITPMDVDFIIERCGQFLVGEIKRGREDITQGQMILLRTLAGSVGFTVFALVGDIEEHEIWPREMLSLPDGTWRAIDRPGFFHFCCDWFKRVDGHWYDNA